MSKRRCTRRVQLWLPGNAARKIRRARHCAAHGLDCSIHMLNECFSKASGMRHGGVSALDWVQQWYHFSQRSWSPMATCGRQHIKKPREHARRASWCPPGYTVLD